MPDAIPHYCIDTSALINWWDEDYSPDVFEGLPERMTVLIEEGRICSVRAVRDEIKDTDPKSEAVNLSKWCKAQRGFYVEDDEDVQAIVKELMARFQVPKKKLGIDGADPFVIGRAIFNGNHWHVISNENPSNGSAHKNPNIPFVCNEMGVKHMRFLDLLRMERWKLK